jgi:beta-lactamase regulating signal transducer with metallopeptidase domain
MPYNSPLSAVSMWITFSVQIACGYVLTRILSALFRSHRVRLRLWTCFLLLTVFGWIFLSAPVPAGRSMEVPPVATQQGSVPRLFWPVSDSLGKDLDQLGAWAAWIYLSVVTILLLQLLAKRLRLDLILRNRQEPSPELMAIFGKLCREMAVRRCQLSLLAQLRSPATTGCFRARVLLPVKLLPRLNSDELTHILRHELIHVKRRDYFWDRVGALGCRILFFHPAVWLAYRRMRWERELACDQAVVENSWDSRLPYAECLTGLARWWFIAEESSSSGIGFSSSSSLLATRIRELLREPRRVSIFEMGLRTGLIAAMFVVGVVFLPSVALTLYRSGSRLGSSRLPSGTLLSASRVRAVRKGNPVQIRRGVPLQTRNVPARAEVQDPTLRMLLSSGSAPIPILQSVPVGTPRGSIDQTASGRYGGGYGAESPDAKGTWDESSTPRSGSASTTLRQAAIDAISIGVSTAGGGGRESTGGEASGGEQGNQQGNHLQ